MKKITIASANTDSRVMQNVNNFELARAVSETWASVTPGLMIQTAVKCGTCTSQGLGTGGCRARIFENILG